MGKSQQQFSTAEITPKYMEMSRGIYIELRDNTDSPIEALSILTTIMVMINRTSGVGTSLEEFAEAVRKNIINTTIKEGTMQ